MKKIVVLIMMVALMSSCQKEVNNLDVSVVMMASPYRSTYFYYNVRNNGFEDMNVKLKFSVYTNKESYYITECKTFYAGVTSTDIVKLEQPAINVYFVKVIICK